MVELLEIIDKIAENSVTLAVVVIFLVYMYIKNGKNEKAFGRLSDSLDRNADTIERNSKITQRLLSTHDGNKSDMDDLLNN